MLRLKRKLRCILIVFFLASGNIFSQSRENTEFIIDTTYYFNDSINTKIISNANAYTKVQYFEGNKIRTKGNVIFDLISDTHFEDKNDSAGYMIISQRFVALYDGEYIELFRNGEIKTRGYFSKELPIKSWETFNENGILIKKQNYSNSGLLEGIYHEYYGNGKLKISGNYILVKKHYVDILTGKRKESNEFKSVKNGLWKLCSESGTILKEEIYKNGEKRNGVGKDN